MQDLLTCILLFVSGRRLWIKLFDHLCSHGYTTVNPTGYFMGPDSVPGRCDLGLLKQFEMSSFSTFHGETNSVSRGGSNYDTRGNIYLLLDVT